jgi:hypothetical protein
MRTRVPLALLLVAALALPALAPASASAASYQRCRGSYGFDGSSGGRTFRGFQALRVTCRTARRVVKKFIRTREYARNKRRFTTAGLRWNCATRFRRLRGSRFSRGYTTCAAGRGRRVKFFFGS